MDQELKEYLDGMRADMTAMGAEMTGVRTEMTGMRAEMTAMEHRLVEKMRDMQTELLRGFEAFSMAQNLRLRKVEADQSNLDTSLRGRVDVLEGRLLQIEFRLGIQ